MIVSSVSSSSSCDGLDDGSVIHLCDAVASSSLLNAPKSSRGCAVGSRESRQSLVASKIFHDVQEKMP